jgi:hypothetical protein
LRLVLFLAAFAAAGPMPTPTTFEVARVAISINWFHGEKAGPQETQPARVATPATGRDLTATLNRNRVRPHVLHSHSLFQRPPPLRG